MRNGSNFVSHVDALVAALESGPLPSESDVRYLTSLRNDRYAVEVETHLLGVLARRAQKST